MTPGMTAGEPRLAEWGVAALPLAGQTTCGDRHLVQPFPGGLLAGAVDGLGHGEAAAAAADIAVATLAGSAGEALPALVRRCHERLRETRGAVMSLASIDAPRETLSWLGIGNVEAVLVHGAEDARPTRRLLVARPGVVGYALPRRLEPEALPVHAGDVLVFATDGIDPGGLAQLRPLGPPRRVAERVLARHAFGSDDALVLVLRYLGRKR